MVPNNFWPSDSSCRFRYLLEHARLLTKLDNTKSNCHQLIITITISGRTNAKFLNWKCFLNSVTGGFSWVDLLTSMIGCFNCPNTASHVQSMQSNLDYLDLHYPDFSIIWTCCSGPIFYQHLYSYLPFSKLWIIWTIKPMILHKSG